MSKRGSFALLAAGMMAGSLYAATPLVKNGQVASVIVTADEPTASQKLAAEELQYHLEKMTGATVPILAESRLADEARTLILVGQSKRLAAMGIDTSKLPPETLMVKTVGQTLILAGEDNGRTGTLYAVYDFLEDQLGCRWLWPGPAGEAIPRRDTVEVGALDITESPQLFRRHMRSSLSERVRRECEKDMPAFMAANEDVFARMQKEEGVWLRRMRMGSAVKISYGHAFTTWWARYKDTDPDLFALLSNGKRGYVSRPDFVKMCVSNPKLIEMLIDRFAKARAKDPTLRFLNACEDDGSAGWCTCEKCRAWDVALDPKMRQSLIDAGADGSDVDAEFATGKDGLPRSLSNRYFTFYNKLAQALRKVAPDASVVTYAYSRYKDAPVNMKLEPNMLIGLNSTFNMYPMNQAQFNEARRNYNDWLKAGVPMFLRTNELDFSPSMGVPWSAAHQMGEDLSYAVNHGTQGCDFDSLTGQWATAATTYYLMARLQWDTHAKVDDILNEFYSGFGPCASLVKEYFDHYEAAAGNAFNRPGFEESLKTIEPAGGRLARWRGMAMYYTDDVLSRGRAIIEKAAQVAAQSGDLGIIQRVHVLALGQRHGELVIQALKVRNRIHPERDIRPDEAVDTTELMPILNELFRVRKELAQLGAENIFYLTDFELKSDHDLLLTSAWHKAQAAE